MPRKLGISPDLYCAPLVATLHDPAVFSLSKAPTLQNSIALREQHLDAAFLSPLDYARNGSEYRIVRNVAVTSDRASNAAVLLVPPGIQAITSLGFDPSSSSEIFLARLILAEQFDSEPTLLPVPSSKPEDLLKRADAALLTGDAALRAIAYQATVIDLVEEWTELTGLPYVHGFWCGRERSLDTASRTLLQDAALHAREEAAALPTNTPKDHGLPDLDAAQLQEYLEAFSYAFDDQTSDALREFLQYAYYHGVLPDVPELNFYPAGDEPDETDPSDLA